MSDQQINVLVKFSRGANQEVCEKQITIEANEDKWAQGMEVVYGLMKLLTPEEDYSRSQETAAQLAARLGFTKLLYVTNDGVNHTIISRPVDSKAALHH